MNFDRLARSRLENGLELLVQPTEAPVTSVWLWLDAGVVDEQPEQAGLAHFLEHMVFKGSATRGVGRAAADVEAAGGDLNAWTSHEETALHASLDANDWPVALDVIADLARGATFDAAELERERAVVLEEIRSYDDDPETVLGDAVLGATYPDHPYGRPVLGWRATVSQLTRDDVLGFWRRNWGPNRARVAVVGPVNPDQVAAAVQEHFATWKTAEPRRTVPRPPAPKAGPLRVRGPFDSTAVSMSWSSPGLGDPDLPALDVLMALLAQGSGSLLERRLNLASGLATDPDADQAALLAGGTATIGFLPLDDRTVDAISETFDVLREVAAGPTGTAVARARELVRQDALFDHETVDGIAQDLCWATARAGGPEARANHLARVAQVTPEDVASVTRRHLDPSRAVIGVLDERMRSASWKRASRPLSPYAAATRPVAGERTVHGIRVAWLPDDGPVVGISLLARGGGLCEQPRTAGCSNAWSRLVTAGAGNWDAEALAERLDALGAVLDAVPQRSAIGLHLTVPAAHAAESLDLLGDLVRRPHFDADEWSRVAEELEEDVATLHDRPTQVAQHEMWRALWNDHPWRLPPSGTLSSIRQLSVGRIASWHRDHFVRRRMAIALAGPVDPELCIARMAPWLKEVPPGRDIGRAPIAGPVTSRPIVAKAGRDAATVTIAWRSPGSRERGWAALHIAAQIAGAQSGRLFLELREAAGLCYSTWCSYQDHVDGGVFTAGLTTDPARVGEAEAGLLATMTRLSQGVSTEEVERARRSLVGQTAMSQQRASARAAERAGRLLTGVGQDVASVRNALRHVSAKDVTDALGHLGQRVQLRVLPR